MEPSLQALNHFAWPLLSAVAGLYLLVESARDVLAGRKGAHLRQICVAILVVGPWVASGSAWRGLVLLSERDVLVPVAATGLALGLLGGLLWRLIRRRQEAGVRPAD